jgi:hypothetical protein
MAGIVAVSGSKARRAKQANVAARLLQRDRHDGFEVVNNSRAFQMWEGMVRSSLDEQLGEVAFQSPHPLKTDIGSKKGRMAVPNDLEPGGER